MPTREEGEGGGDRAAKGERRARQERLGALASQHDRRDDDERAEDGAALEATARA